MRFSKYILSLIITFALVLPLGLVYVNAAPESDDWLFIDGINIPRQGNSAVVYQGISRALENRWGVDVVVDAEGKVTEIIESNTGKEEGTAVPQDGFVLSVSGSKTDWVSANLSVGNIVCFDPHTQRLFPCDSNGNFDPYVTKSFNLNPQSYGFAVAEDEGVEFKTDFVYTVTLDGNGKVIARGRNVEIPEGGVAIEATTEATRNDLIAYAPLGSVCTIKDNVATFSLTKKDLKACLDLAIANATQAMTDAKTTFAKMDLDVLETLIAQANELGNEALDYKTVFNMIYRLETQAEYICSEGQNIELRAAFHTPEETSNEAVKKTVLQAKMSGLNTIILRVSNGFGTFIPLPDDNKFSQDSKFNNFDILKSYIKNCNDNGISLALCFDVYYNEYASIANSQWLSETNTGEEGMSKKFFSPANAEFKAYYIDYVKYVLSNYDIKTVMFDSLRYPKFNEKTDLGYDFDTMEMFAEAKGVSIEEVRKIKTDLFSSPLWSDWVSFRSGLVTSMATDISTVVRETRSDVNLLFVAQRDTISHYYLQDSVGWLNYNLFDGVCVALYDGDEDEKDLIGGNAYYDDFVSDKCSIFQQVTKDNAFLFAGLESSNELSSDLINRAIGDARNIGANGFVLSNLTDFVPKAEKVNLSTSGHFPAVSPLSDLQANAKTILEAARLRMYNDVYLAGACDFETVTLAHEKIDAVLEAIKTSPFTFEQAKQLEDDMGVIFAASEAKSAIVKDFSALTKMAKLAKSQVEEPENPPVEESKPIEESSEVVSEEESSVIESSVAEESVVSSLEKDEGGFEFNFGEILIYAFVGFTAIAALTAMIVGIKRKKNTPSNRHMPKGSAKGYEDKQ